jgi:hypothetical protein
MTRTATATALPSRSADRTSTAGALRRLVPLWRHAVWLVSLVGLVLVWVDVRVDVQQLRSDLRKSEAARREAQAENEHLRLELASRRRAIAMEAAGRQLALTGDVGLATVSAPAGLATATGGLASR